MSNYRVFGANQSINSYFAAISRHQGWFPYFSTGPVGRHAGKKGYSANPSSYAILDNLLNNLRPSPSSEKSYLLIDGLPQIINMILNKNFTLCLSGDIFSEYQEVLGRGKFKSLNQEKTRRLLLKIRKDAKLVKPSVSVDIIKRDPEDNKFLECALEAQADYFITDNIKHFSFKNFRNIHIITPKEFLDIIAKIIPILVP